MAANAAFNKVAVFQELIRWEPHNAMYYEEVQRVQKNQHIHVAIKLQHVLETDDNFRKAAGLPRLDLPEHLWGVRDMRSAHTREQDFMAITAEVEILCQQLKGRGMYPVPSTPSTTNSTKPGGSVHFQPIDPAQKSSVQAMNQSLLNSSLNLLDDSPGRSHPAMTEQPRMNKRRHEFLHMDVTTPYRLHRTSTRQLWISTRGHNLLRFHPG